MRLLLTGATGFVAPYVARAVRALTPDLVEILGTAQNADHTADFGPIVAMDLGDAAAIDATFAAFRPTHVIHLGGVSAVQEAEADYALAWRVNVMGTIRCARALMEHTPDGVFIYVGSAQVYGEQAKSGAPLSEACLLAPTGEYAVTKAAADLAIGALAGRGLKVVRFRPFNHTGPGQNQSFVIPRFAAQIARIEAGAQPPTMTVGNLEARRDFLDVRDVADAYARALAQADDLPSGAIFNLASGRAETIRWVLDQLVGQARAPVNVVVDQALWRPNDIPLLVGDAARASAMLGWKPVRPLEGTIQDVLQYWRDRIETEAR